ncbi:hypothetical protein AA0Z99_09590 [Agrococcus sp. 1P02AA]|uniref:hypothetical protein n=1 Tax=Agrococcus sp. 1P02AA TaxID=3132259 RepID=UPI0039A572F7
MRASMAAELRGLLRGRRQGWVLVLAVAGSLAGGLTSGAIAAQVGSVGPLELATMSVSRGAATPIAVALLAALAVAGPYRDGGWLHAVLGEPRALPRALAGAVPMLGLSLLLGLLSATIAAVSAAALVGFDLGALALAVSAHLLVTTIWSAWMLCLAHATRSPLATLAVGVGVPVIVEPALAGLMAQLRLDPARWALPGQALRAVGEVAAGGGAVLLPVPVGALAIAVAAIAACTLAAVLAAWLRMRAAQPR